MPPRDLGNCFGLVLLGPPVGVEESLTAVDVAGRTAHLGDGQTLPYDALVLASLALTPSTVLNVTWRVHRPRADMASDGVELRCAVQPGCRRVCSRGGEVSETARPRGPPIAA